MRVYEGGGVTDAELIKSKTKTRERVEPPLTAAEQRHVAEGCPPPTLEWRCGAHANAKPADAGAAAVATSIDAALAARRGPGPAFMKFWRRSALERRRVRRRAWPAEGRCRSACGTFSVSAFRLSGSRRSTPTAAGAFSARGSHGPS